MVISAGNGEECGEKIHEDEVMTLYKNGTKLEYMLRDYLEGKNYEVVRSAGSRGPVDLVGWNAKHMILMQCKRERKKLTYADDVQKLRSVRVMPGTIRVLAVARKGTVEFRDVDTGVITMMSVGEVRG